MKFESVINEFVERCKEKFKGNLISVVLFGSVARGTARERSDVDVLVIAHNLPEDWRERDQILNDIVFDFILRYGVRVFPIICTPKAVEYSASVGNPLFYGIMTGYKILHGSEFFDAILREVKEGIKIEKPTYYDRGKKWELAAMI